MSATYCLRVNKTSPWKEWRRELSTPKEMTAARLSWVQWPRTPGEFILTQLSSSGTTTAMHPWQTSSLCCLPSLHWYPGSKIYEQALDEEMGQLPNNSHRRTDLHIHQEYTSGHSPVVKPIYCAKENYFPQGSPHWNNNQVFYFADIRRKWRILSCTTSQNSSPI